jgi:hypothetical protein
MSLSASWRIAGGISLRGKNKSHKLSRLIPKFHFCSVPLFREEPLISWTYTDAVLFTAYDVYRSHDFWLDEVVNSGSTLKEALVNLGFPKTNSLVIDTGVFEMEAKKAGISKELGIDVNIEMSNAQIFEAYDLSGADFFVAPDEIILPLDGPEIIREKVDIIKSNLLDLLDIVKASKTIAVIQGHEQEIVDDLLDFYRENHIRYLAVGGVIPLYHYDRELLSKHLSYVRRAAKSEWLHVFGLSRMSLLPYYLQQVKVDSVDTSALTYLTAGRKYLVGLKPVPVRLADFDNCSCPGCRVLSKEMSTRSAEFFANLYIHNVVTASIESKKKYNSPSLLDVQIEKKSVTQAKAKQPNNNRSGWMTAEEAFREKRYHQ